MNAFDAVLFDFGHTLFTTRPPEVCAAEFREANGSPLDEGRFALAWDAIRLKSRQPEELAKGRDLDAQAHRHCWLELLAPLDEIAPGLAEFTYDLESSPRGWEPYPDTRPVLAELKERGLRLGVVSDCGWDIRPVFEAHGLAHFVSSFDLSYEHGACKPAPEIFESACEKLSVSPSRALMVGDSWLTDGGAAAAGIVTLILPARDRAVSPALSHVLELAR